MRLPQIYVDLAVHVGVGMVEVGLDDGDSYVIDQQRDVVQGCLRVGYGPVHTGVGTDVGSDSYHLARRERSLCDA
jgi:hypothetical protein